MSLPQLQEAFQRYVLQGDAEIAAHVVGTERVPVHTRLSIYSDGYRSRLIEALAATYPVLAELLGASDFETLGGRYVNAHESTFASIRYYGDRLAEFLASDPGYARVPLLAELASWEWAMAGVFDAPDAAAIEVSAFAELPPEDWSRLNLQWSPSVRILELEWNVPELWKAVTEASERPEPALHTPRSSWLLWRRELQIYFRPLAEAEAALIAASRAGAPFGELCVLLCSFHDEQQAARHAAGWLRGWVESGLIVGTDLAPPS